LKQRIQAGAKARLLATLAYDRFRFILFKLTRINFWPFDIFKIFGRALIGPGLNVMLTQSLGLAFHMLNGVTFATAYAIWWSNRGIWTCIGFGLAL